MKVLKACAVVLAVGTVLVGCSASWEEEVQFKVTRITPERQVTPGHIAPPYVVLALTKRIPTDSCP